MEGAHDEGRGRGRRATRVAEEEARYANVTPKNLPQAIAELEKRMFNHAQLLEFEAAAQIRDEIASSRSGSKM